jgi:hypothetical protein
MFVSLDEVAIRFEVGLTALVAAEGFRELGVKVTEYTPEFVPSATRGLVAGMTEFDLLFDLPHLDYPNELREFLGRSVQTVTREGAETHKEPIFIKPVEEKAFTGFVWRAQNPPIMYQAYPKDGLVWISDPVSFVSEYRCFVMDGRILDVRLYKGDWSQAPDKRIVERAVDAYKGAPRGYALDIGVTDDGQTLLVEVNDGFALGHYGLKPRLYAELLEARWEELVRLYLRPVPKPRLSYFPSR